jgi:hypothetical protein
MNYAKYIKNVKLSTALVKPPLLHTMHITSNKAGNTRINVTLTGVCEDIVAVEKQYVLHILSVGL